MLTTDDRRKAAGKAIADGTVNELETIILKWKWGWYGDFYKTLFEAIGRADHDNLHKLSAGFPNEVRAFIAWRETWIANSLEERGLLDLSL
jgi:hypothetical protein